VAAALVAAVIILANVPFYFFLARARGWVHARRRVPVFDDLDALGAETRRAVVRATPSSASERSPPERT
jgi:hypothetical protein